MFAAPLLLCLAAPAIDDALLARDLAPFARVDAAVRALGPSAPPTVGQVTKALKAIARTPTERARAAYDWTTEYVAYTLDRRDAAGAIRDRKGDCDAHAAVFVALCRGLGLEAQTISGSVRFGVKPASALSADTKPIAPGQWLVSHAWNAVRIEGRWGFVDTTMGAKSAKEGAIEDDYFFPHPSVLASDHVPHDPRWGAALPDGVLAQTPILRPFAWRSGIDPRDLRLEKGCLSLGWRKGLRASFQSDGGVVPDRALAQPSAGGTELRLCPTGNASIAWLGLTVDGTWRPLAGYPIVGAGGKSLPRLMKDFYDTGATLLGPFEPEIEAGKPTTIKLRAPGASAVVAFQGTELVGFFTKRDEDWTMQLVAGPGEPVEIMASYAVPNRFQALLTYKVR